MSTMASDYCTLCGDDRSIRRELKSMEFDVRSETLNIDVPVKICDACNTMEYEEGVDPAEIAFGIYRRQKGLLTPEEIRAIRERYRLSQRSFAALLGMSEATINRYEGGGLQDETHDTAIRCCANPDVMQDHLRRRGDRLSDFQRQRIKEALDDATNQHPTSSRYVDQLWNMPDEVSILTGYRQFNYDRYAAVVVWFCRHMAKVTATSLNKLLFYADFLLFRSQTVSLTGTAYRSLPYGPVPADFGGLREQMELDQFVEVHEVCYQNGNVGEEYKVGPRADELQETFSGRELTALEKVADTFRNVSPSEISERSHKEAAWLETEDKMLISYDKAADLSLSLSE